MKKFTVRWEGAYVLYAGWKRKKYQRLKALSGMLSMVGDFIDDNGFKLPLEVAFYLKPGSGDFVASLDGFPEEPGFTSYAVTSRRTGELCGYLSFCNFEMKEIIGVLPARFYLKLRGAK